MIFGGALLIIIAAYFIWLYVNKKSEQESILPLIERASQPSVVLFTPVSLNDSLQTPPPAPQTQSTAISPSRPSELLPSYQISQKVQKFVYDLKNMIIKPNPVISSNEIILDLTKEEFDYLYPESFIISLIASQNTIKELDPSFQPLEKIETDVNVRLIQEKMLAIMVSEGLLTKEEADRFITTIRFTLPQLQLTELKIRDGQSKLFDLIPILARAIPSKLRGGLFLSQLVDQFLRISMPTAKAACGFCITLPECWRPGGIPTTPGPNTFTPFCACFGCFYGQGCLDRCTLMGFPGVIFDPTTGICGCG